jgi:hypothetical protein
MAAQDWPGFRQIEGSRPIRVEVSVVRPGEHNHDTQPAVVMQVLALARLDGDLQHPHGVVFKEEAVVCRRGD